MKLWVGVTDKSWFEQLAALAPDELNFWQPSNSREQAAPARRAYCTLAIVKWTISSFVEAHRLSFRRPYS